jgi:hypothetical protein
LLILFRLSVVPGTMQALVFAAIAPFQVIGLSENKVSILVYIIVLPFF